MNLLQLLNDKENDLSGVLYAQAAPKPLKIAKRRRYHTGFGPLTSACASFQHPMKHFTCFWLRVTFG